MSGRDGWFGRVAATIGDLDNPFYAEERQRDVWNEASAVGFQAMLFGCFVLGGAMMWLGDAEVARWALGVLLLGSFGSVLAIATAQRNGVHGTEGITLVRPRTVLAVLLLIGALAALPVRFGDDSMLSGAFAGGVVGVVAAFLGMAWDLRRQRRGRTGG